VGERAWSVKKCLKSQIEPVCLSDFRANNPKGKWDDFRQQDGYTIIRNTTRRDQGSLCAYCEMRLDQNNEQISHFHPKSDTSDSHDWTFEWGNLWLACKGGSQNWLPSPQHYLPPLPDNLSCDEYKGAKILDGTVFAPHELPTFPRIFRYEQLADRIEIHVDEEECSKTGIDKQKVQQTIDEFNLNCTRLANTRLALHRQLEKAVTKLREHGVDPRVGFANLARAHLSKDVDGNWPQFFTLIRWRLRGAAEEYLESIGYDG
jgi:uncharacterized protein (TIGR02646 family)